jgi:hypothetical protein
VNPIVYLGLGRSDRLTCEALRGMNVLESFAYRRDYFERYRPTWAGAFLDSGAFTEMTQGVAIDLGEYIAFAQEHGKFYAAIANLDDIRGDIDRSRANHQRMLDAGVKAMPVFHQGEPWSVLDEVIAAAPEKYMGLGFQRPISGAEAWLEEVFSRVPSAVRVHGFAMTSFLKFPFHSVDSATWVYEWKALMSVKGQGADALDALTPGELLEIVMKKYQRLHRCEQWTGKRQGSLFERTA